MDQAINIHKVAEEMVRQRGGDAYGYLRDHAEIAQSSGDIESAITWSDIALAALELLNEQPAPGAGSTDQENVSGLHRAPRAGR